MLAFAFSLGASSHRKTSQEKGGRTSAPHGSPGAEWRSMEAVFRHFEGPLPFAQLQIETTGPDFTSPNLGRIARFFQTMFSRNFSLFHVETNPTTCRWNQSRAPSIEYALSLIHI